MKNYEGIMSIGNMELKDLVIEEIAQLSDRYGKEENLCPRKEDYPHGPDV